MHKHVIKTLVDHAAPSTKSECEKPRENTSKKPSEKTGETTRAKPSEKARGQETVEHTRAK